MDTRMKEIIYEEFMARINEIREDYIGKSFVSENEETIQSFINEIDNVNKEFSKNDYPTFDVNPTFDYCGYDNNRIDDIYIIIEYVHDAYNFSHPTMDFSTWSEDFLNE